MVSRLPTVLQPARPLEAGQELGVAGITPLVIANDDFYRIDTASSPPVSRSSRGSSMCGVSWIDR